MNTAQLFNRLNELGAQLGLTIVGKDITLFAKMPNGNPAPADLREPLAQHGPEIVRIMVQSAMNNVELPPPFGTKYPPPGVTIWTGQEALQANWTPGGDGLDPGKALAEAERIIEGG